MLVRFGLLISVALTMCIEVWGEPDVPVGSSDPLYVNHTQSPPFSSSDPLLAHVWTQSVERLDSLNSKDFRSVLYESSGPYWGGPIPWYGSMLRLNTRHPFLQDALLTVQHPTPLKLSEHTKLGVYYLEWPAMLREYWLHTGDRTMTESLAETYLKPWFEYFRQWESDSGLLSGANVTFSLPEYLKSGWDSLLVGESYAVLNAFYYHGLNEAALLLDELGYDAKYWHEQVIALRSSYRDAFLDSENNTFRDGIESDSHSVAVNALSLCFGLAEHGENDAILNLIRAEAGSCPAPWMPYLIEACFQSGASQLGYDLITFLDDVEYHAAPHKLISGDLFGLNPLSAGWEDITFAPRLPEHLERARVEIDVPLGRIRVVYDYKTGYVISVPLETRVMLDMREGERVVVRNTQSHTRAQLTVEQQSFLESQNWSKQVGDAMGVWIDIDTQMMLIIQGTEVIYQARCASAEKGVGSVMNSLQTPLGWHSVVKKVGDGAPWGQVFRSRAPTREIWQPGEDTKEDLVLTRILLLTGEEPGKNKGGNVDSFARNIYIHGTNDEMRIGTPSSHGCIRLTNDDVIDVFEIIPKGMKVLLTVSEAK